MNNTLTYAKGIDYWTQQLQTNVFDILLPVWGITSSKWNSYGRVYINRTSTDDGYIPEAFTGTGYEYSKDLFFNDSFAVTSFIAVTDEKVEFGRTDVKAQYTFFANLSQITPGGISTTAQRLDDVFVNDVHNTIRFSGGGNVHVTAIVKKIDKVLEQYSGKIKRDAITRDMQPWLAVRFDFQFSYNNYLNS